MKSALYILVLVVFGLGLFACSWPPVKPDSPEPISPKLPSDIKQTRFVCPATATFEVTGRIYDNGAWIGQNDGLGDYTENLTDNAYHPINRAMECTYHTYKVGDREQLLRVYQIAPEGTTCEAKKVSFPRVQMYFECK